MGLSNKTQYLAGSVPEESLDRGLLWSAARILELGKPCKAVIVQTQPLGMRNPKGDDMYAFVLTITAEGQPPYKIWVGSAVPAAALPLLSPGNTLPAKRMPDSDDTQLVVDWQAALAQPTDTTA